MDGHDFDNLTRRLAAGRSRRGLLKAALAGLAGLAGGLRGAGSVGAATACTSGRQCPSRRCVDGFCCDRSCTGQCEACNLPGTEGVCTPVVDTPVGNRPACTGAGVCQASCDGVQRAFCASYPGLDVVCDAPVCAAGWLTTYGCGGNGTCHPTTTTCGLFLCNPAGTACLPSCQDNDDCVGAAFCANGVCQGDQAPGEPCTAPDQCQSGLCVDGVCCIEDCDDPCRACNVPGNFGFCAAVSCTTPGECETAPGTCDPQSGACTYPDALDNSNCGTEQACCAGVCCPAGEECLTGVCVTGTTCLGLDQFCDPANNLCCQDEPTFCEATSTCHAANPGSDPTCCHRTGDFCTDTCDCCDFQLCRDSKCCRIPPEQCDDDDQCCSGVCCDGVCCNDFQACCNGACQAETQECVGTVPMGGSCEETDDCVPGLGLTCADGGRNTSFGGSCGDVCCSPTLGASCAPNTDGTSCRCCGGLDCGCPVDRRCSAENVVCGGSLSECSTDDECVSGRCDPTTRLCCNGLGGVCQDGVDVFCCGTVGCGSGSTAVCGGPGASCTDDGECVSGTCDAGSCA